MVEKLTYIELADGQYPIKCDLAVLELAQEEYGKLGIFERELSGLRKAKKEKEDEEEKYIQEEPSIKAVRFVLPLMLNEGIDLENRYEKGKRKHIMEKDLPGLLTDVNVYDLANALHREFCRSFQSKNPKSTQAEEKSSQ